MELKSLAALLKSLFPSFFGKGQTSPSEPSRRAGESQRQFRLNRLDLAVSAPHPSPQARKVSSFSLETSPLRGAFQQRISEHLTTI